jgi:hypothetical protein
MTSERTLDRDALEAVVWGMPIVSVDAMRQAFLRDAGGKYGDIVFLSRPADWRFQLTTPNASTHYAVIPYHLKDGPWVLEIPPAIGAGLFGSINDAWQEPRIDVGPTGEDAGKGGRYLLVPPGYRGDLPEGYFVVHLDTFNAYTALRAIPESSTQTAIQRAIDLVKRVRVYPLAQAAKPPASRFIDMAGKLYDGIVRFDAGYFTSLARMVQEEPAMPRDAAMHGRLGALGIAKGRPFAPDIALQRTLADAAARAHRELQSAAAGVGAAYWSGTHWRSGSPAGMPGPETGFAPAAGGPVDFRARGLMYFLACAPAKRPERASFYLLSFVDATGEPFTGNATYRLRVPAAVPAGQFWAATVYDASTASFIREAPRTELSSYSTALKKNADGSIDLHFGPTAPPREETNWLGTGRAQSWFLIFRLYGPLRGLFDKSWKLPDVERVRTP